jgi:hypothetical protein
MLGKAHGFNVHTTSPFSEYLLSRLTTARGLLGVVVEYGLAGLTRSGAVGAEPHLVAS